ncbi:MAG: hypothetical protein IV100_07530 [Myxococcales bacterium]|nr:hypothetical protein [Myxococcales bacterium]
MKKHLWLTVGGVAVAAGAVWTLVSKSPSPEVDPAESTPSAPLASPRTATVPARRVARLDGRYAVRYALTLATADSTGPATTVDLRGALSIAPAASTTAPGWAGARLDDIELELSPGARAATDFSPATDLDLGVTWAVRFDDEGRVLETRFPVGTSVSAQGLLSSLARGMQVVVPHAVSVVDTRWAAPERDVNMGYDASYVIVEPERVEKSWSVVRDEGSGQHHDAVGRAEIRLQSGQVASLTLSHHAATAGASPEARSEFSTTLDAERVADVDRAELAGFDPASLAAFDPSVAVGRSRAPAASGRDVAAIAQGAGEAAGRRDPSGRRAQRDDLTRTLRARPGAASEVATMLRQGGHSEPVERTLIEALAGAGNPAAQRELSGLLTDRATAAPLRGRLLAASAFVTRPSEELLAALGHLARGTDAKLASMASMSLGAAVAHTAARSPERGLTLMNELIGLAEPTIVGRPAPGPEAGGGPGTAAAPTVASSDFGAAPSATSDRVRWVHALGNTGMREAFPLISAALHDPKERVRIAAARALRFQGAPAKELIAMALMKDDSIHVREAALDAARWLGPELTLDLVQKALDHDVSDYVRINAGFTVAAWAATAPGLRKVLADAVAQEWSLKVKETLRNYLTPGRVAAPYRLVGVGDPAAVLGVKP